MGRGRWDAVDFTRCVIMRADFDIFFVIRAADADEKPGVLLLIGGLGFSVCVKNIAEPHGIGTLVFVSLHPE